MAKIRDFGLAKKAENNKKKQVSSSVSQGGCFVCGCLQGIQFGISILKPPQKNFRERLPKIPPFVSEIDNKELAGLSDAEGVADDEFSPSSCSKEWNSPQKRRFLLSHLGQMIQKKVLALLALPLLPEMFLHQNPWHRFQLSY